MSQTYRNISWFKNNCEMKNYKKNNNNKMAAPNFYYKQINHQRNTGPFWVRLLRSDPAITLLIVLVKF